MEPVLLLPTRVYSGTKGEGGAGYDFELVLPERPGVPETLGTWNPPAEEIRHLLDPRPLRQAWNRPPYVSGWKPGDPPPLEADGTCESPG